MFGNWVKSKNPNAPSSSIVLPICSLSQLAPLFYIHKPLKVCNYFDKGRAEITPLRERYRVLRQCVMIKLHRNLMNGRLFLKWLEAQIRGPADCRRTASCHRRDRAVSGLADWNCMPRGPLATVLSITDLTGSQGLVAVRDFELAYHRFGSWSCENETDIAAPTLWASNGPVQGSKVHIIRLPRRAAIHLSQSTRRQATPHLRSRLSSGCYCL
jgi:hypothetical protein